MIHLDHDATAAMQAAEQARGAALGELEHGQDPSTLRRLLLEASGHYERAAHRIPHPQSHPVMEKNP